MPPHRSDKKNQLQRGSACLSCRRRKIRCDGVRPSCGPCNEHQRPQDCHFDDYRKKSRTQILREKVESLERKVEELERNPQARLQSHFESESPEHTDADSPFGGSPNTRSWPLPEAQVAESSSSAQWTNPIASDDWMISIPLDDGSDLSSLRQKTPIPNVNIPLETQQYLLHIFDSHRAQCHFYSNMTRFHLSLLHQLEEKPHPALLHAINLMGCYFSRDAQLREWETDLLKQSLYEISVSLQDCKHLGEVVQASSLLALYCYFNNRFVEGYRHAFVAARLAVALNYHQIPYPHAEYYENYEAYYDRITVFWQVYMVDRAWSGAHGTLAALSEDEYRGRITTPMIWTSDPLSMMDPLPLPNYLCHFFDMRNIVTPNISTMSVPALKSLASAIYDRTFHPVTGIGGNKKSHPSVIIAMQRIQNVLPQFVGREMWLPQAPHIDVELLLVHTMLRVSELHFSEEEENRVEGDAKLFWAAQWLTRAVDQLSEDDYPFLDPLIAGVWNQGAKLLIKKGRHMKDLTLEETISTVARGMSSTTAFVDHCVDVLLRALRSLSSYTRVAVDYVESLEQEFLPLKQIVPLDATALLQ